MIVYKKIVLYMKYAKLANSPNVKSAQKIHPNVLNVMKNLSFMQMFAT